jgi:hypothetical protein
MGRRAVIGLEVVDGRLRLVITRPAPQPAPAVPGRETLHCPACGRYSREAPDGLPDCTRHGVQTVMFA